MSTNYSSPFKRASRAVTPQSEPIPDSGQVQNNAGGFVYSVTPWERLERFLILGAEDNTYYVQAKDLVKANHTNIIECLRQDPIRVVKMAADISFHGRAPKNDPAIFVLALAFKHGAGNAEFGLSQICRTGSHMLTFARYVNDLRGWGRRLRRAVAAWYTGQIPSALAYQLVKYQQRDGWSHHDVLRLAHPTATNAETNALFRWVSSARFGTRIIRRKSQETEVSYAVDATDLPEMVKAYTQISTADDKTLVRLITSLNLPREAIPTEKLNSVKVWEALLQCMPLTALIRNLAKMTEVGLLAPLAAANEIVCKRLSDAAYLHKSRVHPLQVLTALKTYASGQGVKGSLHWKPVPQIVDALNEAFYASFKNVQPVCAPVLLALDVSGSMSSSRCMGGVLTCAEVSAAMALVTANVERNYHVMGFSHELVDVPITPKMRLDDVTKCLDEIQMGGTDCALPALWATKAGVKVGGIVIYTDNETWYGHTHPSQALRDYRRQVNAEARQVVVGITATEFTIADPQDKLSLDVVGFDASAPAVIANFIRGSANPATTVED